MAFRFTWDWFKAAINIAKHQVTFEEALSAFDDPLSLTILDPDHSIYEERFLLLGRSMNDRLLVVSHVERGGEIRLISARPADRHERRFYEEGE